MSGGRRCYPRTARASKTTSSPSSPSSSLSSSFSFLLGRLHIIVVTTTITIVIIRIVVISSIIIVASIIIIIVVITIIIISRMRMQAIGVPTRRTRSRSLTTRGAKRRFRTPQSRVVRVRVLRRGGSRGGAGWRCLWRASLAARTRANCSQHASASTPPRARSQDDPGPSRSSYKGCPVGILKSLPRGLLAVPPSAHLSVAWSPAHGYGPAVLGQLSQARGSEYG